MSNYDEKTGIDLEAENQHLRERLNEHERINKLFDQRMKYKIDQVLKSQFPNEDDYKNAVRIDKMIHERIEDDALDGDHLISLGKEINKLAKMLRISVAHTERVGDYYEDDFRKDLASYQNAIASFYDDTFFDSLQDKFNIAMDDVYSAVITFREVVAYRNLLNEIKSDGEGMLGEDGYIIPIYVDGRFIMPSRAKDKEIEMKEGNNE